MFVGSGDMIGVVSSSTQEIFKERQTVTGKETRKIQQQRLGSSEIESMVVLGHGLQDGQLSGRSHMKMVGRAYHFHRAEMQQANAVQ